MRACVLFMWYILIFAYRSGSLSLTIRWRSLARYRGELLNGWRRLDRDGFAIGCNIQGDWSAAAMMHGLTTNTSIRQDDDRRYNGQRFAGVPGMVPGFPRAGTRGPVSYHYLHDWLL